MSLTINQAIDKLTTNGKKLSKEQKKLYDSLMKFKIEFGGRTEIENTEQVKNIIDGSDKKD